MLCFIFSIVTREFFFYSPVGVWWLTVEPAASHMLGRCLTPELYLSPMHSNSKAADPAVSVKGHCFCPAFAHLPMVRKVFEAAAEVGGQPFLALVLGGVHSQQSVCIDQKWDDSLGKRTCHAGLAPEFNPGGRRKGSSHKHSFVLHTCAVTFMPPQSHNEWFFLKMLRSILMRFLSISIWITVGFVLVPLALALLAWIVLPWMLWGAPTYIHSPFKRNSF